MNKIFNFMENNNQDCFFTLNINNSSYLEKLKNNFSNPYDNLVFCILDNNDIILSNTIKKDKKYMLNKRILEILTNLEEDNEIKKFNYNEKEMKISKIQNSIQKSQKGGNNLSSFIFLSDYYKINFIIVDYKNKKYFPINFRDYNKNYIIFKNNKLFYLENFDLNNFTLDSKENFSFITIDIKNNIYKNYLDSITKYKINDLKELAKKNNISLIKNGKNKLKKDLYQEINSYYLNLI